MDRFPGNRPKLLPPSHLRTDGTTCPLPSHGVTMQTARPSRLDGAICTTSRARRGGRPDFRRLAPTRPALDPHRPAGGCWRGACEALDGGCAALIVRCRPSRSTGGTRQAKQQPANENHVHSGSESPGQTFGTHSDIGPDADRHSGKSVGGGRHEPAEPSG
jgi:hypothetical protein